MLKRQTVGAVCAMALGLLLLQTSADAAGLSREGPRLIFIYQGPKEGSRVSAAPVPLSPGVFIVPFSGTTVVSGQNTLAAQFQRVTSSFVKAGGPGTLFPGGTAGCCG